MNPAAGRPGPSRATWSARPAGNVMRAVLKRRNILRAACLMLAAGCCACSVTVNLGPAGHPGEAGQDAAAITVGSFDFPESVLLADIYAARSRPTGSPSASCRTWAPAR